jgi:hypothetical protein
MATLCSSAVFFDQKLVLFNDTCLSRFRNKTVLQQQDLLLGRMPFMEVLVWFIAMEGTHSW